MNDLNNIHNLNDNNNNNNSLIENNPNLNLNSNEILERSIPKNLVNEGNMNPEGFVNINLPNQIPQNPQLQVDLSNIAQVQLGNLIKNSNILQEGLKEEEENKKSEF